MGKVFPLTDLVSLPSENSFQTPNQRLPFLGYHGDYGRKKFGYKKENKNEVSIISQNIS